MKHNLSILEKKIVLVAAFCLSHLTGMAQPQLMVDKHVYEFGQIAWKRPVSSTFTLTNKGNKPLVISHVSSSCGCTAVKWTQTPIEPGKSGTVTTTFDATTLGHFDKMVGIYCNASDIPVYLRIRGDVVSEIKDYSGSYPYTIGALRLNKDSLVFTDVRKGEKPVMDIQILNTAKSRYTPIIMQMPPYLTMESLPPRIMGTRKGTLRFTLDSEKLHEMGFTETTMYLARFEGDKVDEKNAIHVSALLLPSADPNTSETPKAELSDTLLNFGRVTKNKETLYVTLHNTGHSNLKIEKLQLFSPALNVGLSSRNIEPGKSKKMKITVQREFIQKNETPSILLITNDPNQPKLIIKIKASR